MTRPRIVLVTGAAGFVGRHVCHRLRRDNISFVGLDHHSAPDIPELQLCDISDAEQLSAIFRQHTVATVIHLAAVLQSVARVNPALATRVNVVGGMNLLEAASQAKVTRFLFSSSMSVYGLFGSHHLFTEHDPTAPVDLYGTAKRYVELLGERVASQNALEFVTLRIAGVVGAGSGSTTSAWRSEIFEKLGSRSQETITLPFLPDSILSIAHVEDVADMLVTLARAGQLSATLYNSPAENWPIQDLKDKLQATDSRVVVELGSTNAKLAPPLSDGALFCRDFDYKLPSLENRLRQAAQRRP